MDTFEDFFEFGFEAPIPSAAALAVAGLVLAASAKRRAGKTEKEGKE